MSGKRKLSLSQLRALEAVVRTGSFSVAAKELGVSQPSVSNHVQALESRFKTKLLAKFGYSVTASPTLIELLPRIRAALAICDDLERELDGKRELASGELRIGYSTYQLAIPRISKFMSLYPNVSIEARAMATQDLLDQLEESLIDIAFITAKEIPAHLTGHELISTRIVLAAPHDHPLVAKSPVNWSDLDDIPLIQREGSSGTRKIFDAAATIAGAKPKTLLALGSWGSIASLIRSGIGLGVAMAAEITPRDDFSPVHINDPALVTKHFVVCQSDMVRLAAVDAFLRAVPEPM